ncbi:lipid transfer protein [Prunus yedoensis var. nudiflora]|uniref:Non-specific lipid-transfer protein n=1 Tax=Prunus yedoensis var. nudiflora TaxID=2094558 RepID=A0A314XTV7_PRUYE|nr:lipid transfer protein [Prunus yedoensis var. nudiflora]
MWPSVQQHCTMHNLRENGGAVPPACCNGIRNVNNLAKTTADRQATCNCLKQLAGSLPESILTMPHRFPASVELMFLTRLAPPPTAPP